MKVKELVELLLKQDQDAVVGHPDSSYGVCPIDDVTPIVVGTGYQENWSDPHVKMPHGPAVLLS